MNREEKMSKETWTFNELKFPKPDLRAFVDMNEDAIRRVEEAQDGEGVLEVIFEHNQLLRRINDLLEVMFVKYSIDTTDEEYAEGYLWANEMSPLFEKARVAFYDVLYNGPYKSYIEERLGPMYFFKKDISKKLFCEENIPLTQREAELAAEYQKLIAECRVVIDGEERNFMELQRLFTHEDRKIRKEAFKAFSDFLKSVSGRLDEIWDELIKIRNQMGINLGYDNFLPVGYLKRGRVVYGQAEIENFRKQVLKEIVPLCKKLFEAQGKRLGVDEVMAYDETIFFPDGNARPVGDEEYMWDQLVEMFRELSPETDEFIDFMLEHELIDKDSKRVGKAAREYATIIESKKAPFVFSFFDGSAKSLKNIVGSMGHAFATYRSSRKQPIEEYYSSSADIMEIHVMSMTQFSNEYAERFFGEDAGKYEGYNLHDLMTFIPFGVAVDEFQHICYANPDMTPKERNLAWRELEKKYMPWRKYDADDEFMENGGYWYHKQHIFLYPLYYIEYPFATINAMEMYKKFVNHPGTAWQDYLALADMGGSRGYLDTLKAANLTPPYQDGAVAKAIGFVKKVLEEYISDN